MLNTSIAQSYPPSQEALGATILNNYNFINTTQFFQNNDQELQKMTLEKKCLQSRFERGERW